MDTRSDTERLVAIETTLTDIKTRLFGNGQPGVIDQLHNRLNVHGLRLAKLENWRWWLIGIGLGLGMASGAGLTRLLESVLR